MDVLFIASVAVGDRPAALIIGYATPPPHAWSRAPEALAKVVQGT